MMPMLLIHVTCFIETLIVHLAKVRIVSTLLYTTSHRQVQALTYVELQRASRRVA